MNASPLLIALVALGAATPRPVQVGGNLPIDLTAPPSVQQIPWGSGPGTVGHRQPQEANAEGPMSFVVDAAGTAWILDQVNWRVAVFPRQGTSWSFPLRADTFQDLALDGDGLAAMDRLAGRTVQRFNAQGALVGEFSLDVDGLPPTGGFSALVRTADGFWAQVDHAWLVRLADAEGRIDPAHPARPGLPDGDRSLRAGLAPDRRSAFITAFPEGRRPSRLARVIFDRPIQQIDDLEVDAKGRLWLAARLVRQAPGADPDRAAVEAVVLLDHEGRELERFLLPTENRPEEQLRVARLGADGRFHALLLSASGAALWSIAR